MIDLLQGEANQFTFYTYAHTLINFQSFSIITLLTHILMKFILKKAKTNRECNYRMFYFILINKLRKYSLSGFK